MNEFLSYRCFNQQILGLNECRMILKSELYFVTRLGQNIVDEKSFFFHFLCLDYMLHFLET